MRRTHDDDVVDCVCLTLSRNEERARNTQMMRFQRARDLCCVSLEVERQRKHKI